MLYDDREEEGTLYKLCKKVYTVIHCTEWLSNRCDYVNYDEQFRLTDQHFMDACHARAGARGGNANTRYTHVFFNYRHPNTDEMLPHYIDWLVNESPFATVFLSKKPRLIMQWGAIVDWKVHKGLAFGACIATRATWEHANHMILWWELVKAGVNRTYAYLVAFGHTPSHRQPREGALYIKAVTHSTVRHGGVDPSDWCDKSITHWFSGTTRKNSENERAADLTFNEKNARTFHNHFPLAAGAGVQGRFGAVKQMPFEDWIKFHVDNHVAIMETFTKKKPEPFQKAKVLFNENEPVEDF